MGAFGKECIACAEIIREKALLCRFCGTLQDDPRFQRPHDSTWARDDERQLSGEARPFTNAEVDEPESTSSDSGQACRYCVAAVDEDWLYCDNCGNSIEEQTPSVVEENSQPTTPVTMLSSEAVEEASASDLEANQGTSEVMDGACNSCQAPVSKEWNYCENCGYKITAAADLDSGSDIEGEPNSENSIEMGLLNCRSCQSFIEASDQFCSNCGDSLTLPDDEPEDSKQNRTEATESEKQLREGPRQFSFLESPQLSANYFSGKLRVGDVESESETTEVENDRPSSTPEEFKDEARLSGPAAFLAVFGLVVASASLTLILEQSLSPDEFSPGYNLQTDSEPTQDSNEAQVYDSTNESESQNIETPRGSSETDGVQKETQSPNTSRGDKDNSQSDVGNQSVSDESATPIPEEPLEDLEPESNRVRPDDDRYLAPGWDEWPDPFFPFAASEISDFSDWDNQYFFEAGNAAKLRDSVTVGQNTNGIGFCEPGTAPQLGSYTAFFSEVNKVDIATCNNAKGTVFVFVTDSEWLKSQYGDSLRGNPPYSPRLHWAVGRPLCSSKPFAMIALEDEGVPPAPKAFNDSWTDSELYPQILALPTWDLVLSSQWSGGWVVDSCGEDCFRFLFETPNPTNASCKLMGDD